MEYLKFNIPYKYGIFKCINTVLLNKKYLWNLISIFTFTYSPLTIRLV